MGGKVQMIFEGDDANLVRSLDKQREKLRKLQGEFDTLKRKGQDTGKSLGRMGTRGREGLQKIGAGFTQLLGPIASVGGAIATATKLLSEFNAEKLKGMEGARGSFEGFQKLAQISGGDVEKFRGYIAASAKLAMGEGVPLEEALGATFAGASTSLTAREMASMSKFGRFANVEAVYRGTGKLLAGFTRAEVGGALAGANMQGIAAEFSDVSLAEFAPEVSNLGSPSRMIGVGASDAMATLSVLSAGQGKDPSRAATQIVAVMTQIRKSPKKLGIREAGSFPDMIRAIQALPEADRAKYFEANVRAAAGLEAIGTNLGAVEALSGRLQNEADVLTGTPGSFMNKNAAMFMRTSLTGGLIRNRRSIQERNLSAMGAFGPAELDFDTLVNRSYTSLNNRDDLSGIEQFQARLNVTGMRFAKWLGMDTRDDLQEYMAGLQRSRFTRNNHPDDRLGVDITKSQGDASLESLLQALRENTEAIREGGGPPIVEDRRTQIFYGSPNERSQMRSPAGRIDPSTGR